VNNSIFPPVINKAHQHLTDQELLQQFHLSHDNELLGALLQRYTLLLFGVCMKYLKNEEAAKDAVQQVFLKAIQELHKYKVEYFKSWIYMVAKNHCLMQFRNKGNQTREIDERLLVADEDAKEEHVAKEQLLSSMEAALQELNAEQRVCVQLFYLEKKSYAEITSQTNYNLLQVKSYIQNGKRNLKIIIERNKK
jgi:RNA polymerase sigma factor (sigma-70 family)